MKNWIFLVSSWLKLLDCDCFIGFTDCLGMVTYMFCMYVCVCVLSLILCLVLADLSEEPTVSFIRVKE